MVDVRWADGRLASLTIARAPPSAETAALALSEAPLSVCCAASVCGAELLERVKATGAEARALPGSTVWAWQIERSSLPWTL